MSGFFISERETERENLTSQSRRVHPLRDVRQRLIHLVNQDQAQIAFLQTLHRAVNRQKLTMNFVDVRSALCAVQTLTQKLQHLAIHTPTLTGVLVQHHIVKRLTNQARLLANVFVSAVARATDHHAVRAGWSRLAPAL